MPLDFPDVIPRQESARIDTNEDIFISPLNGAEQVAELPGSKWSFVLTFSNLDREEVFKLRGFLAALRGRSGTFYYSPVDAAHALTSPTGSPIVNGPGQTGATLITSGWGANQLVRRAGEYIEVNGELKMITQDANSDASGNVTLSIAPNLHGSPPNASPIEYETPKAIVRLANSSSAAWQLAQSEVYAVSFNCKERIN